MSNGMEVRVLEVHRRIAGVEKRIQVLESSVHGENWRIGAKKRQDRTVHLKQ